MREKEAEKTFPVTVLPEYYSVYLIVLFMIYIHCKCISCYICIYVCATYIGCLVITVSSFVEQVEQVKL